MTWKDLNKKRLLISIAIVVVLMPLAIRVAMLVPTPSELLSESARQTIAGVCLLLMLVPVFGFVVAQCYLALEHIETTWKDRKKLSVQNRASKFGERRMDKVEIDFYDAQILCGAVADLLFVNEKSGRIIRRDHERIDEARKRLWDAIEKVREEWVNARYEEIMENRRERV